MTVGLPTCHPPFFFEIRAHRYISEIPGKGMRSAMVNAFNLWLDVPASKLTIINSTVDMLHNASLLSVGPAGSVGSFIVQGEGLPIVFPSHFCQSVLVTLLFFLDLASRLSWQDRRH